MKIHTLFCICHNQKANQNLWEKKSLIFRHYSRSISIFKASVKMLLQHHSPSKLTFGLKQNHWMVKVKRTSGCPTPPAQAGPPRASCLGPCPDNSWKPALLKSRIERLFFILLAGSWTPQPHGHCSQGCLWSSHPLWSSPCWCTWDPADYLSSLTPLSLGEQSYHLCILGIICIVYILLWL